jgi:FMN phosphatase YigB (HAD superfamily)
MSKGEPTVIRAIIFDFGNVLCRLDRPACNRALAAHSKLEAEAVGRLVWGGDIERDAETGRIDSREHFRRIRTAIDGEASWTYDEFVNEYQLAIQPYAGGERAVLGAKELGLRCFILSNTSFLHARVIFANEVFCTVPELHALSFRLGWMKPDPRCWTWILERANLSARECLYVDDAPAYCSIARDLGFRAMPYEIGTNDLLQSIQGMIYSG